MHVDTICYIKQSNVGFYRFRVGARNDGFCLLQIPNQVRDDGLRGLAGWERYAEYRVSNCSLVIGVFWS